MTATKSAKSIRVAIVEDDKWLREKLVQEIGGADGFVCIGAYSTAEAAITDMPERPPDVAVLDINLPGMNGIDCLRLLKPLCPNTRFMMLTAYGESERIFQAMLAGAGGYLLKRTGELELLEAIRQAHAGDAPMSRAIARRIVMHFNQIGAGESDLKLLTAREREVLELLAHGAAYKEIADKLSLSIDTIRMNVKHIYAKLQVHSRGEAVAKFLCRP